MSRPTRLSELRRREGLTMVEVSAAAGVSLERVRRIELAEGWDEVSEVRVGTLVRLSRVFGVSPAELVPRLGRERA